MNSFDASILLWLNRYANRSPSVDAAILYLNGSNIFKGAVLMAVVWWLWFAAGERRDRNREILVATIVACFVAIILGRTLASLLPFRVRPLFNTALLFTPPVGAESPLRNWSAFPSDHAMLFSAMATGLMYISLPLGIVAHAYWMLVVGFPRLYIGLHHPTDLIVGAVLGIALTSIANTDRIRRLIVPLPMAWLRAHASSFYACFFMLSVQIGTMFTDLRAFLNAVVRVLG